MISRRAILFAPIATQLPALPLPEPDLIFRVKEGVSVQEAAAILGRQCAGFALVFAVGEELHWYSLKGSLLDSTGQ